MTGGKVGGPTVASSSFQFASSELIAAERDRRLGLAYEICEDVMLYPEGLNS